MKSITKKFFIYVLCALLSVSACSCSYVRSVYAIEYVGGALAFEEALKWLLGAIGIVSAGGMTADYWENHGDEFVDYCAEQNITNAEVAEWQMKLCSGVLDKASSCWGAFKAWAKSLVSSESGSGSGSGGVVSGDFADYFTFIASNSPYSFAGVSGSSPSGYSPYSCVMYVFNGKPIINFWLSPGTYTYNYKTLCNGSYSSLRMVEAFYDSSTHLWSFGGVRTVGEYTSFWEHNNLTFNGSYYEQVFINYESVVSSYTYLSVGLVGGGSVDNNVVGLENVNTDVLDIINSDIVDEENSEVSIPLPGLDTSDDTISSDTYDDIVDAINDGTISLDDGIAQIQDLLRVIVYDDTTDEVVPFQPDPDTGDNKTKDEVIQENRNNMGFTLFGLENVFPFCIPWDIVAFINVLKAPAVAPIFNLPFPNVQDLEHPLTVRVDLSGWSEAMALVRLAEDFLFIIGLAFLTRSMIGAGGDS